MRRTPAHHHFVIPVLCALAGAGCATRDSLQDEAPPADPERVAVIESPASADTATDIPPETAAPMDAAQAKEICTQPIEEAAGWLDSSHNKLYKSVCGTVAWFDGFFGDKRYDAASQETYGRVALSGFWDQRDGFDPKLRFRANLALPALEDRANLMIGRGDDRDLIEERDTQSDSIPSNFGGVDNDSLLIGLGFRRGNGLKRGMDFSVGIKVKAPPQPYAKARYRRAWSLTSATLLHFRPIVYWKSDEGFGTTIKLDLDQLLNDKFMIRWSGSANITEDKKVEGVGWSNWLSLFQALTDRNAISYSAFVLGETQADVKTQNYGMEIRYRRRIARKWLFMEIVNSVSWPREFLEETREFNYGIGLGFEMYFGPVPDYKLR